MAQFFTTMEILQLALLCSVLYQVNGNEVSVSSKGSVNVRPNEEVDLSCTADSPIKNCNFVSPSGTNYFVSKDDTFKYDDRISYLGEDATRDCGIKIENVQEADNGEWKCEVSSVKDGQLKRGSDTVELTVLKAPSKVSLEVDSELAGESLTIVYDKEAQKTIRCIAEGGQPVPTFSWKLNGAPAKVQVKDANNSPDGMAFQEVLFSGKPEDNAKMLECHVNSEAYTEEELATQQNVAKIALNVEFKPKALLDEYDFYGLEVGSSYPIRISFRLNPAPTNVEWELADGTFVAQGSDSQNGKYQADIPSEGPIKSESESDPSLYTAILTINQVSNEDAGTGNKLHVTNEHGKSEISFKLGLGEKPAVEAGSGPIIAIVIIILVIIVVIAVAVVARSQGLLCFSAKDGIPDAEKGKFEALEKEDSTPEKDEPEVAMKEEKEKVVEKEKGGDGDTEEKKSNGSAHSPTK
jgi:hypothetical protein